MVDSCLGGLVAMMLVQNARDWGLFPHRGTEFFGLSEPTVTFVAQLCDSSTWLLGQAWGHAFPKEGGGVNVRTDSCLGGLVVMMLTWNVRDQGSIPIETLNFSIH